MTTSKNLLERIPESLLGCFKSILGQENICNPHVMTSIIMKEKRMNFSIVV